MERMKFREIYFSDDEEEEDEEEMDIVAEPMARRQTLAQEIIEFM